MRAPRFSHLRRTTSTNLRRLDTALTTTTTTTTTATATTYAPIASTISPTNHNHVPASTSTSPLSPLSPADSSRSSFSSSSTPRLRTLLLLRRKQSRSNVELEMDEERARFGGPQGGLLGVMEPRPSPEDGMKGGVVCGGIFEVLGGR